MKMGRKLFVAAVLALAGLAAGAAPRGPHPDFRLRKHEVSVSGAIVPAKYLGGYDFRYLEKVDIWYGESLAKYYFDAATYNIEKTTLLWSLNYFYNINHRFAVGASVSYEGGFDYYYRRSDDSLLNREGKNVLTTMAHVRFSWMNRPLVRMYSQLSAGAAYSMEGDYEYPYEHISFQISPVGISVGKAVYGYAELGFGTAFVGCNLGIGYRF